ncbi:MAG TPA: LysR family transcriptional regulator [Beijerinckiaceae bacterium]|nr:LysR family transcriptional regulator [Beijerinckiaceae bacterium]
MERLELDIRLLRVLRLLIAERSVSRVAEKLGQTQPAISAALRQLRDIIGDKLLIPSKSGLIPTDRARQISSVLDKTLQNLQDISDAAGTAKRSINIVSQNGMALVYLPRVVDAIQKEAPGITVRFYEEKSDAAIVAGLDSQDIDLVLGNWISADDRLHSKLLIDAEIVCMVRRQHPLANRAEVDLDSYLAQLHVRPTGNAPSQWNPIDGPLARLHKRRKIPVSLPEYSLVPHVLLRSDLVFTTARPYADLLALQGDFAILKAPEELGRMQLFMLWHENVEDAPASRWLRDIIGQVTTSDDIH